MTARTRKNMLTISKMPIMDGIRATQELRQRGCTIPILGLTANADDETRIEAMAAGMHELLTKPISMAALRRAARYRTSLTGTTPQTPLAMKQVDNPFAPNLPQ